MKKVKKIYHYAPISPAWILCNLKECSYNYTNLKSEVNCTDCLKKINERKK